MSDREPTPYCDSCGQSGRSTAECDCDQSTRPGLYCGNLTYGEHRLLQSLCQMEEMASRGHDPMTSEEIAELARLRALAS
jgi:hypothetical protein